MLQPGSLIIIRVLSEIKPEYLWILKPIDFIRIFDMFILYYISKITAGHERRQLK